jgi:hypothetical protein
LNTSIVIAVIAVLAIICVILFGYVMFDSGFDRGSDSSRMSDRDRNCLMEYGMTCEQKINQENSMDYNP